LGNLEKELKYYLDRKSYQRLLRACGKNILKQHQLVTYYFDDKKLSLRKRRFGFRLRTSGGKAATLTLKYPDKRAGKGPVGFKVRREFEERIPLATARCLLKGTIPIYDVEAMPVRILRRHFSKVYLDKIRLLGAMKTRRTLATLNSHFKIEIDRYDIFGKRFYELELETNKPHEAAGEVKQWLKEHDIPFVPMLQSKLSRFLDEYQKQKKR